MSEKIIKEILKTIETLSYQLDKIVNYITSPVTLDTISQYQACSYYVYRNILINSYDTIKLSGFDFAVKVA